MKPILILAVAFMLAGCSARVESTALGESIAGRWALTLPAGFKSPATLVALDDQRFRLENGPPNFRGVYVLNGDRLTVVEPDDARLTEFVWKVQNGDSLLLIEAPPASKVGSDYRGAILNREK